MVKQKLKDFSYSIAPRIPPGLTLHPTPYTRDLAPYILHLVHCILEGGIGGLGGAWGLRSDFWLSFG